MSEHELRASLRVPRPIEAVFAFFADATNLERITPPELHFRIATPKPITMAAGTRIDYRLSLYGIPFGWTSVISAWEPPHRFVDEQLRGPYARWIHEHRFEREGEDATRISDHVHYRLPLAPLGDLALPLVRRQLARIFAYRESQATALLSR